MRSRSGHHGQRKPRLGQLMIMAGRGALLALFAGAWVTRAIPGHPFTELAALAVLVLGWLVWIAQAITGGGRSRD